MFIFLIWSALGLSIEKLPEHGSPSSKVTSPMAAYDSSNNRFLKLGGLVFESGSKTLVLEEFSLTTSYWKKIPVKSSFVPPSVQAGKAVMRNHEFLVFFGSTTSGISSDVYIFNTKTLAWSIAVLTGDLVPGREKFASCIFIENGKTYLAIYGGLTEVGLDSSLYIIEIETLNCREMPSIGDIPEKRLSAAIEYLEGKLYLFGYGVHSGDQSSTQTNLYVYNIIEENWSIVEDKGSDKPEMRMAHTIVAYDNELYVLYGYHLETVNLIYTIWKFSFSSYSWTSLGEYKDSFATECAYVRVDPILYLVGGRTTSILKNSIVSVDFSKQPLFFTLVSPDLDWPKRRRDHRSLIIEDNIIIYGGYYNGIYYDDMWKYNLEKKTWISINMQGDIPSARGDIACTQIAGNAFAIFGGKDDISYYNDLFYYYDYDSTWTLAEVVGAKPTPRHYSSMCYYNYKYYIIGGQNSYRAFDEIWLFDYATSMYTLLSENKNTRLIMPLIRSHCHIKYETKLYLYIVGGSSFQNFPNSNVIKIHLSDSGSKIDTIEYLFENQLDFKIGLSETASIFIDNTAYLFFGSFWNQEVVSYYVSINLNTGGYILTTLQDEYLLYGHSSVYYSNAVYIFGGGVSAGGFKIYNTESNYLYKLTDLDDDLSCSPGTEGENCTPCIKGTYWKDGKCVKCSAGTFSNSIAATSIEQCIPCAYGYYSDTEGSTYCKECSVNFYCPLGSAYPQSYFLFPTSYSSQPNSYKGNASAVSNISTNMWYGLEGFCVFLLLTIVLFRKALYEKLNSVDLFTSNHSKELNVPIVYTKTNLGGLFSLLFLFTLMISISINFLSFNCDNINEIKALVPAITMEETIKAKEMIMDVQFYMYPGLCDKINSKYISISTSGLDFISTTESYFKDKNTCHVYIDYNDFMIKDSEAYVYISMTDKQSYSSGIGVNITVSSSIPNEFSSIFTVITPEYGNNVFRGRKPSIFPYTLTPSVFRSESSSWPSLETGYHISLDSSIEYGSLSTQTTISSEINLLVSIKLLKSNTGMSTIRSLKYSWIMFISTVLGSVFGLMGTFTTVMGITEDIQKKYLSRLKNKKFRLMRMKLKSLEYQFVKRQPLFFSKVLPLTPANTNNI
ncbi:hypothetical protein SteCoe_15331 [Stentor coeruleus]|uniref:Tyrosine-protein kinase ephrin type A/B receptor-like domain-containing protein n=1 Tax=Stentor coeruleus TaxID=5963 RepID=A0A1R2C3Q7_9CILI|nr:hypothetical protein SteCoe_15331 [Stentor coeruleus]